MRPRRGNRVGEVVCVLVAQMSKVAPGVGILMNKQGSDTTDEIDAAKLNDGTSDGIPCGGWNGVPRSADCHQQHRQHFSVDVPAVFDESCFRQPAHGECIAAVQHPLPIHAVIQSGGQRMNTKIAAENTGDTTECRRARERCRSKTTPSRKSLATFNVQKVI